MADLVIKISGDISDFKDKLQQVEDSGDSAGGSLAVAAGIAGAAFVALAVGIEEAVKAYAETERAAIEVTQALQNQGIYSDELVKSYRDQAEELQNLTGVEADSITKAQAKLQSLIGQKQITSELSQAMVDLSIKTGSLDSAAEILGRAVEGNVRGLKQFNIEIDDNLSKDQRLAEVVEKVSQKYGGLAEATNQGLGSFRGLKSQLEEFVKSIGEVFAPAVTGATQILTDFLKTFNTSMKEAKDPAVQLDNQITVLSASIEQMQKGSKRVGRFIAPSDIEDVKKAQNELEILKAQRDELSRGSSKGGGQDPDKKAAADKAAAEEKQRDDMRLAAVRDHHQSLIDEQNFHDAEIVKLEKQQGDVEAQLAQTKFATEKEDLKRKLTEIKELLANANQQENEETAIYREEILAKDKYYNSLSLEEKRKFAQTSQATLMASVDTEAKARQKAALVEAQERIKNHNQFLQDQIKFGAAYATINSAMHSTIYEGSKTAFSNLAQLTQSSNATLKGIGKVAAIANIIIKTAESAMAIFAGFSTIPIVGVALGTAGAAAAVAFGAEQVQQVTSAAQGGLMSGGIPGIDSIPTLTMPGELVVPTKNFDEVIDSVAASRSGNNGGSGSIMVGFDGPEAQRVITIRQNQSKALGTYLGHA